MSSAGDVTGATTDISRELKLSGPQLSGSEARCECLHYSILLVIAAIFLCALIYYVGYETGRIQRLKEHPGYVSPRGPAQR